MKEYTTQKIRNIALIGHGSSGKTTLVEAMLFLSKALNRRGKIEEGTTVTDFDDEEIRRQISLSTGLAPVEWKDHKLNILDTPGYTDFVGEVRSALRVVDLALSVVDAAAGVEVGTELTWNYANDEAVARAVLVNKMDRENASFERALASLKDAFDAQFLPLMLPVGSASGFKGVVNILEKKAYLGPQSEVADIPADLVDQVEELYTNVVEAAVEADEVLMEKYFDDEVLTAEEISNGLRSVIADGSYVPVLVSAGGSETIGLGALLDLLIQIAPSPEVYTFTAVGAGGEEEFAISDTSPVSALVFKTMADPYVGKLTYFRVYGGVIVSGDTLYNSRAKENERLGQVYVMQGKEQLSVAKVHAGDIGAAAKMGAALTCDTLCSKERTLVLRGPSLPNPLYSVAITPKTKADTAKMGTTLTRVCEEDPTLHWRQDSTTHEIILSGMGDAHVETAVRRAQLRFKVGLETHRPKVFRPSIEKGIKAVLSQGVIAGYPIVDVLVAVTDGKEHPVDSKDIAFQIAGRECFKVVFRGAKPVLLEPIYNFEITVPNEFAGAVMSDLNTRRARVQGMGQEGSKAIITATAPLAEMQQYATNLRAISQGRGVYALEFLHYDIVPSHLIPDIIAASKVEDH